MSEFITPPHELASSDLPLVFLAGPVQGAQDWQSDMATKLLRSGFQMNIASPRRTDMDDPKVRAAFDRQAQHAQIDWELRHIHQAIKFGVLVINFAAQDLSLEYPTGRAYAQTTRFEAGAAILGQEFFDGHAHIAVRIDPLYKGGNDTYTRYIAERNHIPVVTDEGALIGEVLARLPVPTRSIHS